MVRALNVEQVVEVFQAREAVEGMAARLACERMGAREHEKLKDLQKRIEAADIDHEPFVGIQLGRELHRIIQESAGNRLLEEFAHKLNSLAILTGNLTSRVPQLERRSRDSHLQIIEALLAKDATGVERLMARHLRETLKGLIREYFGGTVMEPAEELPNEKE
jgi:DNA-binding GntR family transcriptional regulator